MASFFCNLNPEKKRILENIVSLTLVQGTNFILPLITLPYLVRVIGPEKYGLIAFAQAVNQYFISVTDYGFVHTAPKRVSVNRTEREKLNKIFNAVMMVKLLLLLASFLVLVTLTEISRRFHEDQSLYFISFFMVCGNVLFPVWFFQGMEKMKYITFFNMLSKSIFTLAIFVFIKQESDYIYVPVLNSVGLIISGLLSLIIINYVMGIRLGLPSREALLEEIKEGWHVFLGMFSVNLFSSTNIVILGLFANNTIVGYFKAGDSVIRAICGLLQPINNAIYPHISKLAVISKEKAWETINKLLVRVGLLTLIVAVFTFVYSSYIVHIVLGPQFEETNKVVRVLALLPFLIGTSSVLGVQGLLAFNRNRDFSKIVVSSATVNLILAFIMTPLYLHVGMSLSLLLTETYTLLLITYVNRKNICLVSPYLAKGVKIEL